VQAFLRAFLRSGVIVEQNAPPECSRHRWRETPSPHGKARNDGRAKRLLYRDEQESLRLGDHAAPCPVPILVYAKHSHHMTLASPCLIFQVMSYDTRAHVFFSAWLSAIHVEAIAIPK